MYLSHQSSTICTQKLWCQTLMKQNCCLQSNLAISHAVYCSNKLKRQQQSPLRLLFNVWDASVLCLQRKDWLLPNLNKTKRTVVVAVALCPKFLFAQCLCLSLCLHHCDILATAHNRRGRTPVLDRASDFISCSSTSKAVRSIQVHPASCRWACWRSQWWWTGNRVIGVKMLPQWKCPWYCGYKEVFG